MIFFKCINKGTDVDGFRRLFEPINVLILVVYCRVYITPKSGFETTTD